MATVKEALLKLEAHERECAVRMEAIEDKFKAIEKRLDEGSVRFKKSRDDGVGYVSPHHRFVFD